MKVSGIVSQFALIEVAGVEIGTVVEVEARRIDMFKAVPFQRVRHGPWFPGGRLYFCRPEMALVAFAITPVEWDCSFKTEPEARAYAAAWAVVHGIAVKN